MVRFLKSEKFYCLKRILPQGFLIRDGESVSILSLKFSSTLVNPNNYKICFSSLNIWGHEANGFHSDLFLIYASLDLACPSFKGFWVYKLAQVWELIEGM